MFDFTSKEEREAWRVSKKLLNSPLLVVLPTLEAVMQMDEAAARFDAREATCGIEPLSDAHASLILAGCGMYFTFATYEKCGQKLIIEGHLTDKGRSVLSYLNAMCKVER